MHGRTTLSIRFLPFHYYVSERTWVSKHPKLSRTQQIDFSSPTNTQHPEKQEAPQNSKHQGGELLEAHRPSMTGFSMRAEESLVAPHCRRCVFRCTLPVSSHQAVILKNEAFDERNWTKAR
jgi:hypothetical protein